MKMLLLGDVCPTEVTDPLFAEKKIDELFTDTVGLFKGNDFNFVNLECAITNSDKGIEKFGPCLKASEGTADTLKALGVDCCGLSNNHIFDFGKKGVADTLKALKRVGIAYTGFGNNYNDSRKDFVVDKNGEKVAVIAVCEHEYSYALNDRMGSRPFEYDTFDDIRKAKSKNDRVIVIYHGGKEFCAYPSPRLRNAFRAMAKSGADVVIGQHSHCISCYEQCDGSHLIYGQGNFHFVKPYDFDGWHSSLAVKYDSSANSISFTPLVSGNNFIAVAKGEQKDKILREFESRNRSLTNGEWKNGWHDFCESVRSGYLDMIGRAFTEKSTVRDNDVFGHYLDCEAHTDVWRELCQTANMRNER